MRGLSFIAATLVAAVGLVAVETWTRTHAFWSAVAANLVVAGWSAFVLPLRGLPRFDEYYALRAWERSGRAYRALGVPLFRALVRRGPLALFNAALPQAWWLGEPARIDRETRAAEAGHAIALALVLALACVALLRGDPARAAWLAVLDVPMNLYPVLLQRDHRRRLELHLKLGDLTHASRPRRRPARSRRQRSGARR